jgi:hypothetical protein
MAARRCRRGVKIHRGLGPRLLAGGQGRRKPPAFAGEPAHLIRKSSMRSRPTNGRRRRRVVSPRASAGPGPSDSRIPETSRVGAAASPMFHRHKTGQPLTARPKACRALPIPALRYCSELDAPGKPDNRGGETCAFADAKRVRPPGATQSLFARPRPDRGAGLAGSRARAGEPPGTAETGERPPPDQAFERLVEGERALHELRCQTPRFPAECEALVGGQILSPES